MVAISAHSKYLEPGCMWTFGEGPGMDMSTLKITQYENCSYVLFGAK